MSLVCVRGDESISEPDLKAHLAAVVRLENIGTLLGAGASVDAGGLTIPALWRSFLAEYPHTAKRFSDDGFLAPEDADPERFSGGETRRPPDIEALIDQLEIARIDWHRRKATSRKLKVLEKDICDLLRCVIKGAVLAEDRWQDPASAGVDLDGQVKLLQRLIGARQPAQPSPWVFTTNYDLAIEWAAESIGIHVHTGFAGIHNRVFSPQSFDLGLRNTLARGEARFGSSDVYLAKLHGSLSWRRIGDTDFREMPASEMWSMLGPILDGSTEPDDSLIVFPRAAKYLQTVGFLSGELIRRFSDFLSRPQSCLLVFGYSFNDQHINRLLKSALLNPTFQLVVFLPEFQGIVDDRKPRLNPTVEGLVALKSPRITFVGGGESAYFGAAVRLLPDPVLFDLTEREMRERLRKDSDNDRPE